MKKTIEYPDVFGPGTGTLGPVEHHPAADAAMAWCKNWLIEHPLEVPLLIERFASNAIEGNRLAEICHETLNRLLNGEPVSDRYLLGLTWTLRDMEERE